MPARWMAFAALALLGLSGCLAERPQDGNQGGDEEPSPTPPPPPTGACDVAAPLPVVPTWAAHGGAWGAFVQGDLQRPQGIRGAGQPDPGLGLLVDHSSEGGSAMALDVDMALVSGTHPDGAGLVFHWTGPSYNIVRYSPSEGGWHAFTVVDGNRSKIDASASDSPAGPGWCEWVSLRVVASGPDIKAFQDGRLVLEVRLPEGASNSGQAGLFVRGDTVALFDGYQVSPI